MSTWAVILCGGSGTRMGSSVNKTLLPLGGMPPVIHCLKTFKNTCDGIVLVVREKDFDDFKKMTEAFGISPDFIVTGGDTRQASVANGLSALPHDCEIVLIHDGARPFVSEKIIERVKESAQKYGSGIPAVSVKDTIKEAGKDLIVDKTLNRDRLYAVQTPQGFKTSLLLEAHKKAASLCTDDAALLESLHIPVHLVESDPFNFKLTTPEDYRMAQGLLFNMPHVGSGFDAHRLVENRKLILCGVEVPYEKGLLGHSDADVALHALMDAMLGSFALGDIGHLFPDTDQAFKDISSVVLLRKVYDYMQEKSITLVNADITIIAQRPKLAPYIPAMRQKIAETLNVSVDQISVKASTTEKMGYEGTGEGISARAGVLTFQNNPLT